MTQRTADGHNSKKLRDNTEHQLKRLEKAGDEGPLKACRGTPSKEKHVWAAKLSLDPSCSWLTAEETHAAGHEERHSSEEVWQDRVAQFSGARQIGLQQRQFGLEEAFASIFGCSGRAREQVDQAVEGVRKLLSKTSCVTRWLQQPRGSWTSRRTKASLGRWYLGRRTSKCRKGVLSNPSLERPTRRTPLHLHHDKQSHSPREDEEPRGGSLEAQAWLW